MVIGLGILKSSAFSGVTLKNNFNLYAGSGVVLNKCGRFVNFY